MSYHLVEPVPFNFKVLVTHKYILPVEFKNQFGKLEKVKSAALAFLFRCMVFLCTIQPSFCPSCIFLLYLVLSIGSFLLLLWMGYFSHSIFQFLWLNIIPLYVCTTVYLSIRCWWTFGLFPPFVNRATVNMCVPVLVWLPAFSSFGCVPGEWNCRVIW